MNNLFKSFSYCNDRGSKTWLSFSKMTLLKLKQGDKVWIGISSGPADVNNKYTSFSGYKM